MIKLIFAATLIGVPFSLQAKDSNSYAVQARAAWSAFECSSLAGVLDRPAERAQLQRYGYEQGKEFIGAYQAGSISKDDIDSNVPVDFLDVLDGPSPDFMLGRLYESIRDYVGEDIDRNVDDHTSESEVKQRASVQYSERNCAIIGGAR